MKKLAYIIPTLGYLLTTAIVYAQTSPPANLDVRIRPPSLGVNPGTSIGGLVSNALTIIFIAAAILVLFFLVIGAFKWIVSGGDKEAVAGARKTIIAALVGLAILALAFLIVRVVGNILSIDILNLPGLPKLGPAVAPGTQCPNGVATDGRTCL